MKPFNHKKTKPARAIFLSDFLDDFEMPVEEINAARCFANLHADARAKGLVLRAFAAGGNRFVLAILDATGEVISAKFAIVREVA